MKAKVPGATALPVPVAVRVFEVTSVAISVSTYPQKYQNIFFTS
jgi:hypothetical protein